MFRTYTGLNLDGKRSRTNTALKPISSRLKIASATIALVTIISMLPMTYAATIDDTQEMLRWAREKVEIATSPDAFGHGVPIFKDGLTGTLPIVGIIAGSTVAAVVVWKLLLSRKETKTIT